MIPKALLVVLLVSAGTVQAEEKMHYPVRMGVCDAGSYMLTSIGEYWSSPLLGKVMRDLGATHINVHVWPISDQGSQNVQKNIERFVRIDQAMRGHGLTYTLGLETSNFSKELFFDAGVNEFEHPGGLHRWDLRMSFLNPILPPAVHGEVACLGIVYDECCHMQLSNNKFSNVPLADFDKPFLVNTHGMPLEEAYEKLVEECTRIRVEHYEDRIPIRTEQVWPDLFHIFARAGWKITPKLLKEHFTPVVLSIALGAALQYEDRTQLWVSPDLWSQMWYPGHSPEALKSALKMGYWTGAECIYVENLDYHGQDGRHPEAGSKGSLIEWSDASQYQLTVYGKVYQDFAKSYIPSNPRSITWKDYKPKVAIVRLPDGGWGQYGSTTDDEAPSRNRLLGNREHPLDEIAGEWLEVWPILTHGVIRAGAISTWNRAVYPEFPVPFFVPIDSVAVFDHKVTGPVLDGVECFIVCGHGLSKPTFEAISEQVAKGATCIIARRLFEQHAQTQPAGDWLIVDSFKDPAIATKLQPYLGPSDVARYRFKNHVVEFKKGSLADQVVESITEIKNENSPQMTIH